jgi:hypothetical protein
VKNEKRGFLDISGTTVLAMVRLERRSLDIYIQSLSLFSRTYSDNFYMDLDCECK